MRFLELYEQFLLEHNVVNRNDIASYVEQFAHLCKNENAAEWFRHTLANYLEKDDQANVQMTERNVPRNAPDWLEAAIARGDDLRVFSPPEHLHTAFDHLVDFFNYLDEEGDPVMGNRERVLKITVDTALKKAHDWTAAAAKNAAQLAVENVEEIWRDGSYRWVEPTELSALKRDGAILGQCTANGTYDTQFRSKSMRFYILHDPKGQPHVCVSVTRANVLDQVKGKQNEAPVGRYVRFCANFLNHLHLKDVENNFDVRKMGLVLGEDGKLTTVSNSGEVVFTIGNVRVYKTEGAKFDLQNRGIGERNYIKVGGGSDYWFNNSQGDLFKINVGENGFAYMRGFEPSVEVTRDLVQQFMNGYFPHGAPAPLESSSSGGMGNNLVYDLKLGYDYLSKKYGSPEEVSEKTLEIPGGFVGYNRGEKGHGINVVPTLYLFHESAPTDLIFTMRLGKYASAPNWREEYPEEKGTQLLIAVLNKLDSPPQADYRAHESSWREDEHIFFDLEEHHFGDMSILKKLWKKGPITLYRRHEVEGVEAFMMVRDGDDDALFEIERRSGVGSLRRIEKGTYDALVRKILLPALNECEELQWMRTDPVGKLDRYNIFFSKGKWQSREKAGEVFHRFDDGAYVTDIPRGGAEHTYSFYDDQDKLICAITIDNKSVEEHHVFSTEMIRASRYLLWLFNHLNVRETDTLDSDRGYNADQSPKAFLWRMGLFHDTRSDSWKLVQDGKLIYDGNGYRAVNFRNRVFLVDNHDGCIGWFKKGDASHPSTLVTDEHVFKPNTPKELYRLLADLCRHTEFDMPTRQDRSHEGAHLDHRRQHGYTHSPEGEFSHIDDFHPPEVILDLPKGYRWMRLAHDERFYDREKTTPVNNERYSLVDRDGKSFMRVEFDDEFLKRCLFSAKDKFDRYSTSENLKSMGDGPQKKWLLALLEKLDMKLTPTQASELGYYRTKSGAYKAIKGNKALEGFLKGYIDFGDGHAFKRADYRDEWTLGNIRPEEEHEWNRFEPVIEIKFDDDGIESVHYKKKDAKRKPKEYMPYIHKLMQIFGILQGA